MKATVSGSWQSAGHNSDPTFTVKTTSASFPIHFRQVGVIAVGTAKMCEDCGQANLASHSWSKAAKAAAGATDHTYQPTGLECHTVGWILKPGRVKF